MTLGQDEQRVFPRQQVLLNQSRRLHANRNNDGSRRSFAGDATSFRRSDSERSMGSLGTSMRSIKSNATSSSRPKVKKHFVQKVRTSARYLLKKKTARFATGKHFADVRLIETIDEYTGGELEKLWFSSDDLDTFKGEAEDLASLWETQPAMAARSAYQDPFRGLEDKTPNGHWEAYKIRRDVLNAVLDVQDEQMAKSKVPDMQTLADVSAKLTQGSQQPALERGKKDEAEAREHCQSNRNEILTMKQKTLRKGGKPGRNTDLQKSSIPNSPQKNSKKAIPSIQEEIPDIATPKTPKKDKRKTILVLQEDSPKVATPKSPKKSNATKKLDQIDNKAGFSSVPQSPRKTTSAEFKTQSPRKTFTSVAPPPSGADIIFTPPIARKSTVGKMVSTPTSPRKSISGRTSSSPSKSPRKSVQSRYKTNQLSLPASPVLCSHEPPSPRVKQPRRMSLVEQRAAMFGGSITSGSDGPNNKGIGKAIRRASLSTVSHTPRISTLV